MTDWKKERRDHLAALFGAIDLLKEARGSKSDKYRTPIRELRHKIRDRMGYDPLAARAEKAELIRSLAEDGMVLALSSGMGCDGGAWRNRSSLIPAVPRAIERSEELDYEWADGPISHGYDKPSNRHRYVLVERDLGAEAHENGHPHVYRW